MIEIPRAALTADAIARRAEFFSFGTNDLTQTTLGLSRDDAGAVPAAPTSRTEIFPQDPFRVDRRGGRRRSSWRSPSRRGARRARTSSSASAASTAATRRRSRFFQEIGLDYVSCSPFRVPVARLAAAQAALKTE